MPAPQVAALPPQVPVQPDVAPLQNGMLLAPGDVRPPTPTVLPTTDPVFAPPPLPSGEADKDSMVGCNRTADGRTITAIVDARLSRGALEYLCTFEDELASDEWIRRADLSKPTQKEASGKFPSAELRASTLTPVVPRTGQNVQPRRGFRTTTSVYRQDSGNR